MIKNVKFSDFIVNNTKEVKDVLNEMNEISKDKNNWQQSNNGYYKILEVKEDTSNIKDSVITIETWDTKEFSPYHAYAYSQVSTSAEKLKEIYANK